MDPKTQNLQIKRVFPYLHCEQRQFDYIPNRFMIPASSEGYVTLFSNDTNIIFPLDVATDDWCSMDIPGFERLADDSPLDSICLQAKLFIVGQATGDQRSMNIFRNVRQEGGCCILMQCFDFASRKWSKVGSFYAPTNAELIACGVVKKIGKNKNLKHHVQNQRTKNLHLKICSYFR